MTFVCDAETKVATLSTESIASSPPSHTGAAAQCASCGAPVAPDQRYCLECGARTVPMSSVLAGHPPSQGGSQTSAPSAPPTSPPAAPLATGAGSPQRNNTLTVIAGVGVLLLAMGVGVLIGRAGASKQSAAPAQVITLAPSTSSSTGTGSSEASFTGDWPSGTSGYTVQLQTLPQSGTAVSAVEAAKSSASAKGAKAVGALKSEEFSSLTAGSYVIYSGVYHKKPEAEKALGGLKKSFPGAKVIEVSSGAAATSSESSGAASSNNSAPAKVAPGLKGIKGKTYEEKSKNVPNQVEF